MRDNGQLEKSMIMKKINSANDEFQVLLSLKTSRQKRNKHNEIFIEGIESIKQALVSARVRLKRLMFSDSCKLSNWAENLIASGKFEECIRLREDLYGQLCDKNEPSEIAITAVVEHIHLETFVLPAKPFVLIFDRPSDLGNLGSIIRSANALGVDLVITHGHCVDHYEPKVIRASLGAVFHTPVIHIDSFQTIIDWLSKQKKKNSMLVAGTDSTGEYSITERRLQRPIALLLGNEAKGLSVRLKESVDIMLRIPLCGQVNSLNVACAASILMWKVAEYPVDAS